MTPSITLTDAAERLGVHYMTAYRYVRTGRLAAHKHGGQWRVTETDLTSFMSNDRPTAPRADVIPPMVAERLLAGDENGTMQILEGAMASGADADEVYLDLLGPAMSIIGKRWSDGAISIGDEHLASSTALRVVARIGHRVATPGRKRGTILLAAVAEDHHALPTAMIRDLLRFRGFDVIDLGANMPPESILRHALTHTEDLIAVGIAATTPDADDIVRVTLSALSEGLDVPIVVGGAAFAGVDQIAELGDCIPSRSARHALEVFDAIHTDARSR